MPEREVETVSWINVVPLNRRERLARWWQEDVRQGSTYTSRREHEQDFMTTVSVGSVESIACEGLRRALVDQKRDIEESADTITYPRATPNGSRYFGSIGIPTKSLGVRFIEGHDIMSDSHEDY